MNQGTTNERWDFFLAHAGADSQTAVALYEALSQKARVFLDERSMLPGDPWPFRECSGRWLLATSWIASQ
jgi:hypothetical protein